MTPAAGLRRKRRARAAKPAAPLFPRWVRHIARVLAHVVLDGAAVAGAYRLAYELRFHNDAVTAWLPMRGGDPGWGLYAQLLFTVVPLWLFLFGYSARLYTRPWISKYDRFLGIVKGAVFGTLLSFAATYIYSRLAYSRLMLLMAAPIAVMTVGAAHILAFWIDELLARFEDATPLLLVGGGRVSELVRENIRERHPYAPIHEVENIPKPRELVTLAREKRARDVVLVRSDVEHKHLLELAEACESEGLTFRMIPDLLELRLGELQMDESLGLPAYRLQHTQLTRANFLAKRAFDVVFSSAVFLALGPLLLLIAAAIRLDSKGPALFKQKRLGFRGKHFYAYKFRTMYVDAEKRLQEVRALNDQKGGFFKAKDDPRITAVGRWLRRYSVDEFPQFINVLLGDMSVVGPRPLAVTTGEMDELISRFGATAKKRLNTLPGITGLWQVSGRSDISAEQRFALDMFYIERWSLGLDLEIILKTVPAMVSGKGAY